MKNRLPGEWKNSYGQLGGRRREFFEGSAAYCPPEFSALWGKTACPVGIASGNGE